MERSNTCKVYRGLGERYENKHRANENDPTCAKWRECSARDIKLSTASQTELSNTRKVCRGLHDRYQDGRHNENHKSTSAVTLDVTVVPLRFTIVCQHLLLNRPGKKWSQGIRSTATTNKNAFNIAKQACRAFQSIAQAHHTAPSAKT